MKRVTRIALIGGTLLLCVAILTDALPLLRGPAPETPLWYWPYRLRPVARWGWPLAVGLGIAGWLHLWVGNRPKITSKVGLLGLMLLHIVLQLGLIYADASRTWLPAHEAVWAELLDRTLPPLTSGYFWDAAHVDDLPALLRDYPAQMPLFESEHTRTHPPGLLMLNWLTLRGLATVPSLTTPLASYSNTLRCTDLWLIDGPPHVPVALLLWSLLPLIAAAAAIPAAYLLATSLAYDGQTRRLAAALVATLPALLVFAPKVDQLFVPFALLLFAAAVRSLGDTHRPYLRAGLVGVGLGCLTFLSIGNGVLAGPIGLLFLWAIFTNERADVAERATLIWQLLALGVGGLLPWIIFWGWFGPHPLELINAGLTQHYELVTNERPYGVWVVWNLVDVLTYASPVVVFGFGVACHRAVSKRRIDRHSVWIGSLLILLIVLDLSGSARGEVGRIWLFLFALLAVAAADAYINAIGDRRLIALAPQLMLAVALAIGLAWRTVRPVIVVTAPPVIETLAVPETTHATALSAEIMLAGSTLRAEGETLNVSLMWQAHGAARYPYTAFVHVLDAQGALVAQQDNWPVAGQWPPTCWRAGDQIHDEYTLSLPELPKGDYRVLAGMYNRVTLARIGDAVEIGRIARP